MVRQFHDGLLAQVQNDDKYCEPFPVTSKAQMCTGTDTVQHVLRHTHRCFSGFWWWCPIRYRFDGKLFNLRRLHAKSKLQTEVVDEHLYVDDMAKNAATGRKMQEAMDEFHTPVTTMISKSAQQRLSTRKALQWANHHTEWIKTANYW